MPRRPTAGSRPTRRTPLGRRADRRRPRSRPRRPTRRRPRGLRADRRRPHPASRSASPTRWSRPNRARWSASPGRWSARPGRWSASPRSGPASPGSRPARSRTDSPPTYPLTVTADPPRESPAGSMEIHHRHRDVTGGWLRPAVFGVMDGLVSNFALIAGVAGGNVPQTTVVLTARFTSRPWWYSGLRQMLLGILAAAVTFGVGRLVGIGLG